MPIGMTRFRSSVPAPRAGARERTMKKAAKTRRRPEMLDEYDFSKGVRGKYAARYAEGTNVVVLGQEVAEFFPDSASMNAALRALVGIARTSVSRVAK